MGIDCKQLCVALHGPDSLEAEVGLLGPFVRSEPRVFEGDLICLIMSRNGPGALLSIEGR